MPDPATDAPRLARRILDLSATVDAWRAQVRAAYALAARERRELTEPELTALLRAIPDTRPS